MLTFLHGAEHGLVEKMLRLRVERAVDGHHVAMRNHVRRAFVVNQAKLILNGLWEAMTVAVVKLAVKWMHATENSKADASCCNSTDVHTFDIVGALNAVGDVPAAVKDLNDIILGLKRMKGKMATKERTEA